MVVSFQPTNHLLGDRAVGCWPEKAQRRVDLWLRESGQRQQGVKNQVDQFLLFILKSQSNTCTSIFLRLEFIFCDLEFLPATNPSSVCSP